MSEIDELIEDMSELQKVIVLLLNANGQQPIHGSTEFEKDLKLQKELFMIAKAIPAIGEESSFSSDFFGPFSEIAAEEVKDLALEDVLENTRNLIKISPLGKKLAAKLSKDYDKSATDAIADLKDLLNDMSKEELLVFVYTTFPDYTDQSVVVDDVMRSRLNVAERLYKKRKVSLEKASEISGKPLEVFAKIVGK